jgi:PASTA domain-containing protein
VKKAVLLAGIAMLVLAGCSGDKKEAAVPDVVGERLDLAQSHMKDAGLEYEALGGGTLGIVVESNWTVCQTEPAAGATGAKKVKLIVDRVCSERQSGVVGTTSSSTTGTTALTTTTTASTPASGNSSPAKIAVPNVVGKDLQTAQDTMQAAGLYMLRSHDSTGRNRSQVLDSNWMVTDQTPAAGTKVDADQLIDLGAKKFTD